MTPQELKNSILQLAIQGKLVEQRPEEGTAEELYKTAAIQKKILHKSELFIGKKKNKCIPIIEDNNPFDIPSNWKWIRLSDITEIFGRIGFRGYTKNDIVPLGNGAISISPSNMLKDGHMDYSNCTYISWDKYEESPEIKVYEGDILVVKTGSSYGKCSIVKTLPEKATINPQLVILKYILCNAEYLLYVLSSPMARAQYETFVLGTSIPTFSQEKLANFLVPLPPLSEQKRIVAKIEELLPLIDRYEKAWNRLEEFNKRFPDDLQKSLLQMAIQGKLVDQRPEEGTGEELYQQIQKEKQKLIQEGKIKKEKPLPEIIEDEKLFDIPDNWKWVRLLSVVTIATNLVKPNEYLNYKHVAPDNIEKGTGKLLSCRTVAQDKVASANHLFFKGQVLYSKIRPLLRKAVIAPFDGLCSADMYPIQTKIDARFVLYYLLSDTYNHQIAEVMSSRVKMPKINQDELGCIIFPLPPLAEQKRIVAKLEELLPLCEQLKKQ